MVVVGVCVQCCLFGGAGQGGRDGAGMVRLGWGGGEGDGVAGTGR